MHPALATRSSNRIDGAADRRGRFPVWILCAVLLLVCFMTFPTAVIVNHNTEEVARTTSSRVHEGEQPLRSRTVVVVGGGLAGMSAAIEAERAGASVLLIDKESHLGGNSAKASSGINAVNTPAQQKIRSQDTFDAFYQDTIKSGQGLSNERLVDILVRESPAAIEFLSSFHLDLSLLTQLGGHSFARTHRSPSKQDTRVVNIGFAITSALKRYIEEEVAAKKGTVRVLTGTTAVSLLTDNGGSVTGVHVRSSTHQDPDHQEPAHDHEMDLIADAVILTTGGYSRAEDLLQRFVPSISHLPTTNGPFAQGDGVRMANATGAALIHMDKVQLHPTGIVDPKDVTNPTKFLAPEALRGLGGILLNANGERFVNELGRRDHVTQAIFEHCYPVAPESNGWKRAPSAEDTRKPQGPVSAYLVLNKEAADQFPPLGFYKAKGFIRTFPNVRELAKALDMDQERVIHTLREYDAAAELGIDAFGKTTFPTRFHPDVPQELLVMIVTPSIHYTMGGVKIDEHSRILREVDGLVIPGLFAAGEVTGGIHGANRLGGNSLLECVVFGRRAGRAAVEQLSTQAGL